MIATSLLFIVLVLVLLLVKEKFDGRRLQGGSILIPVDGMQLAHDIRSPLMVLKSLLSDGENNDLEKRELIKKLIKRMEEMTSFGLEGNAGHFKKDELRKVNLNRIITDVIDEKIIEFGQSEVQWNCYLDKQVQVKAKEYQLKRILSNIINNARESTMGRLEMSLSIGESENGHQVLKITDNGKGIAKEVLEKIFLKGFSTKSSGHGLGLFHAKETLEKWGGQLKIESEEGVGTTVSILFSLNAPEIVLLENDDLIRKGWEHLAKRKNKTIKTFATSKDLYDQINEFDKETYFYLDEELDESIKGRDVAKSLYGKGFRNIYICSGHEASYFSDMKYILGVVSKDYPFS